MSEATPTGAERIAGAFEAARAEGRAALMPYMMGGFPDPEAALAIADAYAEAGADLVELGIPFSDPLADGPVIHAAATRALEAGATLDSALEAGATISDRVPVVAMAYANMVLAHGAGIRVPRLRHPDDRRARRAPGRAGGPGRRDPGRFPGARRGRLRDRNAGAGGAGGQHRRRRDRRIAPRPRRR